MGPGLKPTTKEERERLEWDAGSIDETGTLYPYAQKILRLIAELEKYRSELAYAGQSLLSYEQSHGTGCGDEEAYKIARLLGYEDDLTPEAVGEWLREEFRDAK